VRFLFGLGRLCWARGAVLSLRPSGPNAYATFCGAGARPAAGSPSTSRCMRAAGGRQAVRWPTPTVWRARA